MKKKRKQEGYSLSVIMTVMVVGIVLTAFTAGFLVFVAVYNNSIRNNTITASEQAVTQVTNTVSDYTKNMRELMELLQGYYRGDPEERNTAIDTLITTRNDVVAVTCYDEEGTLVESWSGNRKFKKNVFQNLSFDPEQKYEKGKISISKPHVETLLADYYPWIVSMKQPIETKDGQKSIVVMDFRFSQIADYVDEVGIGPHGYCFIMDQDGNMVYHPQQQLIFSGLKEENLELLKDRPDGYLEQSDVIYTIQTMEDSGWRVVGVSYVDELITKKVQNVAAILLGLLLFVLFSAICSSLVFSRMISRPVKRLIQAMEQFEDSASDFTYHAVEGSREIGELSHSFGHMVVQIQQLMEKVREEEITLRKAELRALQAQINPHFLYNTLDAIGWLCEEERTQDAVEMVNALAKLFRISISKGHEMITVEKELEHARSYLKIEKFRYKQFTYSFDVDEDCLKYYCNKITLQPIIENAIYHGLDRMVDEGEIRIGVHSRGDNLVFTVEDNGIGMTKEQCREILEGSAGDKTGIGIRNVNNRIKIYFGEQYGIQIDSELDEGTTVTIVMPKIGEGGYEER
ncbi:MAG: cache domain-containing sensor histidine kinase [Lachnospiraceae bacterium]|jgi:two-component system sensor histidine kinase YesM